MKIIQFKSLRRSEYTDLQEIVKGCKKKDEYAQKMLFKRFAPKILTICRRYEHPSYGANDIVQDAFIAVFKNMDSFDEEKGGIETWIRRIAVNTALKVIRGRKLNFVELPDASTQIEDQPQDLKKTPSQEKILACIQSLPLGYKTVFNLFVLDGFKHKQIADLLNIKEQTSKSQLHKAKRMLKERLEKQVENEEVGQDFRKFV